MLNVMRKIAFFLLFYFVFVLSVKSQNENIDGFPYKMEDLLLNKKQIDVGNIFNTAKTSKTLTLYNPSKKTISVEFDRIPSCIQLSPQKLNIPPKALQKISILYNASEKEDWGETEDRIMLIVNNSRNTQNNILIKAYIEEDFSILSPEKLENAPIFSIEKRIFDLGNISNKKKLRHQLIFENKGKSDLIIRKVKSSCTCTHVQIKEKVIKAGESGKIDLVFNPKGKSGKQQKHITIITNDPKNSKIIIEIKGNII
jgi:vacuolar-type H+-ATPase subunit I/STV1